MFGHLNLESNLTRLPGNLRDKNISPVIVSVTSDLCLYVCTAQSETFEHIVMILLWYNLLFNIHLFMFL